MYKLTAFLFLSIVLLAGKTNKPSQQQKLSVPTIDLHKITGAPKSHHFVYKDWSLYDRSDKKLYQDPNYKLSYIVFFIDDIVRLSKSRNVGVPSVTLAQSWQESHFGTTSLGRKGNHFGIKKNFRISPSGTYNMKDDHPTKSQFGTAANYGYGSFVGYFDVMASFKELAQKTGNIAEHKTWTKAIQSKWRYHDKCDGIGCSDCRHLGIKGRVYATMKQQPDKKANPALYTKALNNLIAKHEWYIFDNLSQEQVEVWRNEAIKKYSAGGTVQ